MPRPRAPLPPDLRGRAFRVSDIDALPCGRTEAPDLWIPTRGVRLPAAARDLRSRCRAHALTLPALSAFSHTTAAVAHGFVLPFHVGSDDAVHVTVPTGTRAPRRRGLVGHQRELPETDVVVVGGLRVTSVERTFLDLAELLDVPRLVAVGDRLIWRGAPKLQKAALAQAVAAADGRRSVRTAKQALELMDDGAESPKESELRLLLVGAGFGPFRTNLELRDSRGRFVARVDLALAELRIAVEYEGDHHRDSAQWRKDIARRRRIEALGWIYIPVTQADLDDPSNLLSDLASAVVLRP